MKILLYQILCHSRLYYRETLSNRISYKILVYNLCLIYLGKKILKIEKQNYNCTNLKKEFFCIQHYKVPAEFKIEILQKSGLGACSTKLKFVHTKTSDMIFIIFLY